MKQIIDLKNWNFKINSLHFEKQVTLPHTWNVDDNMQVQLYRGRSEYSTEVDIDLLKNKTAVLYFGCAFHTAEVYVNGAFAGAHKGSGYTPFEFDITAYLTEGKNSILVTVDNDKNNEMLPHALDYDWADDGGLIRNVTLAICDNNDLFDMSVTYTLDSMIDTVCSGVMDIAVHCVPQAAEIEVVDFKTNETVINRSVFIDSVISFPFENLKLWNTESPNLYIVKIKSDSDEISKRIGFRTIEVKDTKVLLNGKSIYMKGCEWMPGSHPKYGMAEPFEHSVKRLSQLKNAGCIFTRFHWQQDTSIFDWCDENGLLVQEEIPYWGHPKKATPLQLAIAKEQADAMVHYHTHHPSIICWGVGNELGGEKRETIQYVNTMYDYLKSKDPTRLVNYVSNTLSLKNLLTKDDAAKHGDIAMWNEYLGLWQPCNNVKKTIFETYKRCGNMPSMVTEFGLCEPHFKGGDERRTEILLERIPIYKSLPNMVGYVWFSLNDYRTHCGEAGEGKMKQRIHGSTDLYADEKPSYKVFSEIE